jgi:hypothetical protein
MAANDSTINEMQTSSPMDFMTLSLCLCGRYCNGRILIQLIERNFIVRCVAGQNIVLGKIKRLFPSLHPMQ